MADPSTRPRRDGWRYALAAAMAVIVALVVAHVTARPSSRLTLWHVWGGARSQLFADLIARFHAENPGVRVDAVFIPPDLIHDQLLAAARSDSLPEVVGIHTDWLGEFEAGALLAPLDALAGAAVAGVRTQDLERNRVGGTLVALPNTVAGGMAQLYVNRRLADAAGLDADQRLPRRWAAFTAASAQIVRAHNRDDVLRVIAWDPFIEPTILAWLAFCFGADAPTVSVDGRRSLIATPGVRRVMDAIDAYVAEVYGRHDGWRGLLRWRQEIAGFLANADQIRPFARDLQAFALQGVWTTTLIRAADPDLPWEVGPLPGLDRAHGGVAAQGWSYAMRRDRADDPAAWALLRWLTIDPAGNGAFCIAQARPSPLTALDHDPGYATSGPAWPAMAAVLALDIPHPGSLHGHVLGPMLNEIPARRASGEPMQQIVDDLDRRYQAHLDLLARAP
ncbi:MAG: extracellular solute-binding protein [Planctomycetes bacterium]|nr:extracellular solute-binding protein [Planctomycetota bacterium]